MTNTVVTAGSVVTAPAVRLTGLVKRYGSTVAVGGVDLEIATGEVLALLGPNGAGKSTTIDMMLGLIAPDAGQARLFGRSPREAVVAGQVGAMLQTGALRDGLTVGETVAEIAALHRQPGRVPEVLAETGLTELAKRKCAKLSGGERQRVRFAIALISRPELIVLDEPTAGMDVEARREFWASMRAYSDTGRTVVFATHYLEEAQSFADRVVLLRQGRVIADGTVAQIRAAASGRTIQAVVPNATLEELRRLPGVDHAEVREDRVTLRCGDSDTALRTLLDRYRDAHDVEVTAAGLEDAFITLTESDPEENR
ncbi:MAG: ABC transporter ATP-binding protein [Hamadaea sp.]|uniref:ABC transporter ATP-binding protein n=1 Tax=Hamadaea sp. TaxID=2024425 RepID=UPI0017ECDAA4|nr:ABC transporter ATP-binding protein [Hamadaea sp.]NUR71666.1 ABC transporter ATP-binding protein [Hamadaea sp.]NUT18158.1 ABC transporter ATP-binding protein [Hamadaea sp.]